MPFLSFNHATVGLEKKKKKKEIQKKCQERSGVKICEMTFTWKINAFKCLCIYAGMFLGNDTISIHVDLYIPWL